MCAPHQLTPSLHLKCIIFFAFRRFFITGWIKNISQLFCFFCFIFFHLHPAADSGFLRPSGIPEPRWCGTSYSVIQSNVMSKMDWGPKVGRITSRSTLFLHGVCMLCECIRWVCTRAARKENPNPNSHDHCLLSKWKCCTCVHTHLCN